MEGGEIIGDNLGGVSVGALLALQHGAGLYALKKSVFSFRFACLLIAILYASVARMSRRRLADAWPHLQIRQRRITPTIDEVFSSLIRDSGPRPHQHSLVHPRRLSYAWAMRPHSEPRHPRLHLDH